jgi:4-hydroxy-tetrahydrodipicolinate synthase
MRPGGELDETALGAHVVRLSTTDGIAGLLINGHAGENAALDAADQVRILTIARSAAPETRIVAGVNSERSDIAARMAADAAAAGADAVMVFPPHSWALGADPRVIVAHHREIAAGSDLPLFLFQGAVHAGRTAFSEDTLARLLEIKPVTGIKEGSWETAAYERTLRLARRLRPDVAVMASGDEHLLACFLIGSAGSLVSLAAIAPELIVALDQAVRAADLVQARAVHDRLFDLARSVYAAPGQLTALRLKTCLQIMGQLDSVACRLPIDTLPESEIAHLRAALEAADVL